MAESDGQAQRERLFRLLGDRDPMEVLARTAAGLRELVRRFDERALRRRPAGGGWAPVEVVGHLVDSEWVYGYRFRLVLCQAEPAIHGVDQDAWVAGQLYIRREPTELVESFRVLREENLDLWRRLSEPDLQRAGVHDERGRESLGLMLRLLAGHDVSHLGQIDRLLTAEG